MYIKITRFFKSSFLKSLRKMRLLIRQREENMEACAREERTLVLHSVVNLKKVTKYTLSTLYKWNSCNKAQVFQIVSPENNFSVVPVEKSLWNVKIAFSINVQETQRWVSPDNFYKIPQCKSTTQSNGKKILWGKEKVPAHWEHVKWLITKQYSSCLPWMLLVAQ